MYLQDLKNSIASLKPYIQKKYNVGKIYIFGSYAREEQNEQSDIDILIDFDKTPDLLTFIELEEFLSNRLHKSVDLVPKRKLKPQLRDTILKEAIAI
ncbi:nucleotidyltransferase [hydrothermal vent metagenome]|uniref:Nucleotidyltransferase n=1 Tax=hydrothermal vent metagenome TaxID=652676 RepID=A0A1W1C3V9_9ZZZZ